MSLLNSQIPRVKEPTRCACCQTYSKLSLCHIQPQCYPDFILKSFRECYECLLADLF